MMYLLADFRNDDYNVLMVARIIKVWIKPASLAEFEEATRINHEGSVLEAGVIRFDVLKDDRNPGDYVLYELYRSQEAVLAHKETDHYKVWKETVAPMLAKPREGLDLEVLYPVGYSSAG